MKTIIILFFIYPIILFSFVENLEFVQVVYRCASYEASMLEHNNKLYLDAKGAVEEYHILEDGSLELNSYIDRPCYSLADAIILGDTLFVGENHNPSIGDESKIFVIGISEDEMNLVDTIQTNSINGLYRFAGNDDYFVYTLSSNTNSVVLDRNTFELVTDELSTGSYYTIKDTILFSEMVCADSSALLIESISDINNPVEIAFLLTGEYQQNLSYHFRDSNLFILRNREILIIDISDLEDPSIITTIHNIPNIPSVNFLTNMIFYENYIIFTNQESTLWIYDITNINEPQLVSVIQDFEQASTSKGPLILVDNDIYFSGSESNIYHIDATYLPDIEILGEYGSGGFFSIFYEYFHPYILCRKIGVREANYFNVTEDEPVVHELDESPYGFSSFTHNDTLLCYLSMESLSEDYLKIYHYNENVITLANEISLGTTNYRSVNLKNDYLILMGYNPGTIKIYEILPDYSLNEIGNFILGIKPYLLQQTTQFDLDYLYIQYEVGDNNFVSILESQPPFDEVANFSMNIFGVEQGSMYLLSDDKVLFYKGNYPGMTIRLCNYNFPDQFELLDTITSDRFFKLHDDLLTGSKSYSGEIGYYTWQNDVIEEVCNYDFGVEVYNNIFVPELNKLYAVGRYNIIEYACDYTDVDNFELPIVSYGYDLRNYPNPFNPTTTIQFNTENTEDTEIIIYNIKGQKVRTFSNHQINKYSNHQIIWNGTDANNHSVGSGVYLYQIKINGNSKAISKMILMK
ncbi:MAG: T9SS type A sorting domain-containing protein [Armatimonadetes bacterium]|nr:T9SS type A sorting domain-containing protein [Armatimonadota bacterium]